MRRREEWMRLAALACGLALIGADAQAQTYPTRPVTIVVTAAAGGVSDVIARGLAQRLFEMWGQQVVVENRGGGGHTLGAAMVAKASPDGHTLMVAESGTYVTNPILHDKSKMPFDVEKDIVPITGLVRINHALMAAPAAPVDTFRQFVDYARSNPKKVTYGTTGVASASHLNMVLLESMTGVEMQAIHYRGAAPAVTDVMAGHITGMLVSAATAAQAAREGKAKLIGIGSRDRMAQLPDVPALAEGVPGFRAGTWFGLATTAGTPEAVIAKIHKDVTAILAEPAFRARFVTPGMFEVMAQPQAEFAAYLRGEMQAWSQAIAKAGFKLAAE
jgi:tripartite-type tricarboxylate transporter receptor subunit TctC